MTGKAWAFFCGGAVVFTLAFLAQLDFYPAVFSGVVAIMTGLAARGTG